MTREETPLPLDRAARLVGAVLGQALGDALGFVVEAQPPEIAAEYVRELRSGMAGRRHPVGYAFGQYSDDTQLARELLLSVIDAGRWQPAAFAARLAALFESGRDVGAGPGSRSAALRLAGGTGWQQAGTPAPYAGNGSAMRVAPLGLLFGADERAMRVAAAEQSRVTHHDPRCAAGAVVVAGAAYLAAAPRAIECKTYLATLAAWAAEHDRSVADAVAGLGAWAALPPHAAIRHLATLGLDQAHAGQWRGISAFVTASVVWSLYAFLRNPDDYWDAVCTAIAPGGDTDTMAAMTGSIAGARLGPDALPPALIARLNDRGTWRAGELAELAAACARVYR
jgi:ADP-ribosylglycohydrolase